MGLISKFGNFALHKDEFKKSLFLLVALSNLKRTVFDMLS